MTEAVMSRVEHSVDRQKKLRELHEQAEKIIRKSKELHANFDRDVWGKDGFHNDDHIDAVEESGLPLVQEALDGGDDPAFVIKSLDKWNAMLESEGRIDEIVQEDELADIVAEALAAHDWGNIMEDISFDEQGNIIPHYLDGYKAAGAEDRGKPMYEKFVRERMKRGELSESDGKKRIALGCHLIEMTKYKLSLTDEERNDAFRALMYTADQPGNDAMRIRNEVVPLTNEMNYENPNAEFTSPHDMFNYSLNRLQIIYGDDEERKHQLYRIWNKRYPQPDDGLSKKKMKMSEMSKYMNLAYKMSTSELSAEVEEIDDKYKQETGFSLLEMMGKKNVDTYKRKREILNIIQNNPGGISSQTEKEIENLVSGNNDLENWYKGGMKTLEQMTPEDL